MLCDNNCRLFVLYGTFFAHKYSVLLMYMQVQDCNVCKYITQICTLPLFYSSNSKGMKWKVSKSKIGRLRIKRLRLYFGSPQAFTLYPLAIASYWYSMELVSRVCKETSVKPKQLKRRIPGGSAPSPNSCLYSVWKANNFEELNTRNRKLKSPHMFVYCSVWYSFS